MLINQLLAAPYPARFILAVYLFKADTELGLYLYGIGFVNEHHVTVSVDPVLQTSPDFAAVLQKLQDIGVRTEVQYARTQGF